MGKADDIGGELEAKVNSTAAGVTPQGEIKIPSESEINVESRAPKNDIAIVGKIDGNPVVSSKDASEEQSGQKSKSETKAENISASDFNVTVTDAQGAGEGGTGAGNAEVEIVQKPISLVEVSRKIVSESPMRGKSEESTASNSTSKKKKKKKEKKKKDKKKKDKKKSKKGGMF